jgi:Trk K+ transport system NAD-binding subunit
MDYERIVPQGSGFWERQLIRIKAWTLRLRYLKRGWLAALLIAISVGVHTLFSHMIDTEPMILPQTVLFVLELMVLETPSDLPEHPLMILFWLAMPVVGLFVLGTAIDIILFFSGRISNQKQRDLWEESFARTYKGHVVILGLDGKNDDLNLYLIDKLIAADYQVVMICFSLPPEIDNLLSQKGIPAIIRPREDLAEALENAGIDKAKAFILTLPDSDRLNAMAALLARKENPQLRIVSRIDDVETYQDLLEEHHVRVIRSISELAAWTFIGAALGMDVSQPDVLDSQNPLYIISLKVVRGSGLVGQTIGNVQTDKVDVMLYYPYASNKQDVRHVRTPEGTTIDSEDQIVFFTERSGVIDLLKQNRVEDDSSSYMVVMGLTNLGCYVTLGLIEMGIPVLTVDDAMSFDDLTKWLMGEGLPWEDIETHLEHISGSPGKNETLDTIDFNRVQSVILCARDDDVNFRIASKIHARSGSVSMVIRNKDEQTNRLYADKSIRSTRLNVFEEGSSPFIDAAAGEDMSPLDFKAKKAKDEAEEVYRLTAIHMKQNFVKKWRQVGDVEEKFKVDVVALVEEGQDADIHPDLKAYLKAAQMLVLFGEKERVEKVISLNQ